jgi:cysteine desulfurase / selenocysteine lyase
MSAVPNRIYFDNAATSFPKPPGVTEAVSHYLTQVGASAGRGAYREAGASGQIIEDCRAALRRLFGLKPDDAVVFTLNGTDALNMALKGLVRPGDHVVTTSMDHNSVLRPLHALQQRLGIEFTVVPADPETTRIDPTDVAAALRPETRLVAVNHASNVTGVLQPLEPIATLCRERGVLCLVDGAQSAGHLPIRFDELPIDVLATPGHKGLLGPLGTGVLLFREGFEAELQTLREGGTGSQSERAEQPETLPDKYEPGSHNAVGIAGLLAALEWIEQFGLPRLREHELQINATFIEHLQRLENVTFYGPREPQGRVGVFSVRIDGYEPQELAAILEQEFGVLSRSGLHCAPWAHETIGTDECGGTTRLSAGPFISRGDVEHACQALEEIAVHAPKPVLGR